MKLIIDYQQYGEMVHELMDMIVNYPRDFKFVFGIPKGGIAIALHVANNLGISKVTVNEEVWRGFSREKKLSTLIVDDIADTGVTFKNLLDGQPDEIVTATLFCRTRSEFKPTLVVKELDEMKWVVFPWERQDEEPNREGFK